MNMRMMIKKSLFIVTALIASTVMQGCTNINQVETKKDDGLYQVATLQSLARGNYYGYETIENLLKNGDTGLGTFDSVNGEMIVLDGVCYQALSDGSVVKVKGDETTPFATVKFFSEDYTKELSDIKDIDMLKKELNSIIEEKGKNSIYVGTIKGNFKKMYVRTEYAQKKPYKPLAEVLKTDQVEFTYEDVEGTLVCVYMPNYMDNINTPFWHLHFIDKECKKGGHVFDLNLQKGTLKLDKAKTFTMSMPNHKSFQDNALDDVSKDDIASVETGNK